MQNRFWLFLGLLAAVMVLVGVAADLLWLRLVAKPFIIVAIIAWIWPFRSRYQQWIIAGLLFSISGGLLLEWPGLFLFGLIAFLLGHLAYIVAYLKATRRLALWRAIPFFLYGFGICALLWPGLESMIIPVGIYILVICTMMWRAAACLGSAGQPTRGEWAALIGAILFALSDSLIGISAFLNPLAWLTYPILILYWAGQLGIAYSAIERV
jgi:alkenylglycerophosphocholine hydrolase